jgi:DNA-binding MurR/RpiR family transcriptional regulator
MHADAMRQGLNFAGRATTQVRDQQMRGDNALAADIISSTALQIARMVDPDILDEIAGAARLLFEARRIYCLGLRSSNAVAAQFAYVMSLLGEKSVLIDTEHGAGLDRIRFTGPEDAVLAISVSPYTNATLKAARYAAAQGARIVAVTDSRVAPLASMAARSIVVSTDSPSFFHSMAPAFVAGEVLAALVAGLGGHASLDALERTERHLTEFEVHWKPSPRRKQD